MHFLIGIAILAGLIGFAFGEVTARTFIGAVLGLGVALVLGVVLYAAADLYEIRHAALAPKDPYATVNNFITRQCARKAAPGTQAYADCLFPNQAQ